MTIANYKQGAFVKEMLIQNGIPLSSSYSDPYKHILYTGRENTFITLNDTWRYDKYQSVGFEISFDEFLELYVVGLRKEKINKMNKIKK